MFGLGLATKIYVAVEAVDMRKGFEGLYGLVRDELGADPLSGHLFVRRQLFLWVGDNYFSRPTTTTLYRSGAKPRGRLGFTA